MENYIILLMKQKFNFLSIIERLNKAKSNSGMFSSGGNPSAILNTFTIELIETVSRNIESLDNEISDIAGYDSIYFKVSVEKDGDEFCCRGLDFVNLQESDNYALGKTFEEAIINYGKLFIKS